MEEREHPGKSKAVTRYLARLKARNKRISLLAVGACALLLLVALIIAAVSILSPEEKDDGLILSNVYVAGVDLGGMNREEAEYALLLAIGDTFTTQDMVVSLPDAQLVLSPADTQAYIRIEDLVDAAYNYGRDGTKAENKRVRENAKNQKYVIALLDYMTLDLDYIRSAVTDFCNHYSSVMVESTVSISGTRPDYSSLVASGTPISSVRHQVLTIHIGTPQLVLEPEALYWEVLDAYSMFQLSFSYDAPISQEPGIPDAQELFDTYCLLPADAEMDGRTYEVIPEVYGYGFDVDDLNRKIQRADYGETITVTLSFLFPDITAEDLAVNYFQNVLATYISPNLDQDANRIANLQRACDAINGMIIKSGESFDFNQILGPRTTNTGYKSAPTYYGSTTTTIGGGIGQLASVLRYCAMLSGLQIDEYHLHNYAVPYTPYGTDAAITYGTENLIFTNTTDDPIQIFASCVDGTVIVSIMGTEKRQDTVSYAYKIVKVLEPEVEYQYMTKDNVYGYTDGYQLQSPLTGYVVELYAFHYDPVTGEEISRELVQTCTYSRRNEILVRLETDADEAAFG